MDNPLSKEEKRLFEQELVHLLSLKEDPTKKTKELELINRQIEVLIKVLVTNDSHYKRRKGASSFLEVIVP
ncbi:hypothetical protein [Halobacillus massiliensis]|uniref:hypothetical protein n=1 Tax=Halobacillus massiliensis TaxID=1926286 RepID=UPI0009E58885|nr:hypothetical protein [Halobacillus massiliensis]